MKCLHVSRFTHQGKPVICSKTMGHTGTHYDRQTDLRWENALDMSTAQVQDFDVAAGKCWDEAPVGWKDEIGLRHCILPDHITHSMHVAGPPDDTSVWYTDSVGRRLMRDVCGQRYVDHRDCPHVCTLTPAHSGLACNCMVCGVTFNEPNAQQTKTKKRFKHHKAESTTTLPINAINPAVRRAIETHQLDKTTGRGTGYLCTCGTWTTTDVELKEHIIYWITDELIKAGTDAPV